jgi:ABC-type Zn uptake system ZnuABC Zn-binding protein ZnuA
MKIFVIIDDIAGVYEEELNVITKRFGDDFKGLVVPEEGWSYITQKKIIKDIEENKIKHIVFTSNVKTMALLKELSIKTTKPETKFKVWVTTKKKNGWMLK